MSDEIDNIKMRARRTPPSMLELCEYYKKKQALTFGSKNIQMLKKIKQEQQRQKSKHD